MWLVGMVPDEIASSCSPVQLLRRTTLSSCCHHCVFTGRLSVWTKPLMVPWWLQIKMFFHNSSLKCPILLQTECLSDCWLMSWFDAPVGSWNSWRCVHTLLAVCYLVTSSCEGRGRKKSFILNGKWKDLRSALFYCRSHRTRHNLRESPQTLIDFMLWILQLILWRLSKQWNNGMCNLRIRPNPSPWCQCQGSLEIPFLVSEPLIDPRIIIHHPAALCVPVPYSSRGSSPEGFRLRSVLKYSRLWRTHTFQA